MKTCPFCAAEIRDAVAFCDKCGRDLPASDSSAASAVLLAVTTWLTWTVRPAVKGSEQQSAETAAWIVGANFDALQFEPREAFCVLDGAMVWRFARE